MDLPWDPVPITLEGEGGAQVPAQAVARLRLAAGEFLIVAREDGAQALRLEGGELSPLTPSSPERAAVQAALLDFLERATPRSVRVAERPGAPASDWFVRDRLQVEGAEVLLVAPTDEPDDNDVVAVRDAGEGLHVPLDDALALAQVERLLAAGPAYEVLPPPGAAVEGPTVGDVLHHEVEGARRELRVEARVSADGRAAVVARDVRAPERVVAFEVGAQGLTGLSEGPLFEAARREVEARGLIRVDQGGGAFVPLGAAKVGAISYVVARRQAGPGGAVFFRRDGKLVKVADPALEARAVDALAATLAGDARDELLATFDRGG